MQMDEVLASTAEQMKNFSITYLVDISQVPVSASVIFTQSPGDGA